MKKLSIAVILALTIYSCKKTNTETVSKYKPLLIDKNSLPNSVIVQSSSDLSNPGKYLINGNFLYVIEKYKGVHIYDNTIPSSPKNTGFISIPGIETISIVNKTLFADNSTDIVAMDISNPSIPVLISRISGVLPQPGTPDGLPLDGPVAQSTWPANSIVVNWVKLIN